MFKHLYRSISVLQMLVSKMLVHDPKKRETIFCFNSLQSVLINQFVSPTFCLCFALTGINFRGILHYMVYDENMCGLIKTPKYMSTNWSSNYTTELYKHFSRKWLLVLLIFFIINTFFITKTLDFNYLWSTFSLPTCALYDWCFVLHTHVFYEEPFYKLIQYPQEGK